MNILSSEEFYRRNYEYYDTAKLEKSFYMGTVDFFVHGNIEKGHVLDVGCGDGLRALGLSGTYRNQVVGLDNCVEMCDLARRNGIPDVICENISGLSMKTMKRFKGYFGTVLCLWNVLGHITVLKDRQEAIRNIANLLGDQGLLFVDVNNRLNVRQYGILRVVRNIIFELFRKERGIFNLSVNGSMSQVYLSTKWEFANLLEENGFDIERLVYIDYGNGLVRNSSLQGQLLAICRKKI